MSASPIVPEAPRRRRRTALLGIVVITGLLLAACGSDDDSSSDASGSAEPSATMAAVEDGAYPVSIAHKYGTTELTEKPQRIVTVGLTDQDAVLALGSKPVGVTEWFGEQPHAVWPWAKKYLGDAKPAVLEGQSDNPAYEKIASLRPDVIVALYSGLTKGQYDKLAKIAATIAQPKKYIDYGIPWQEQTRTIGKVLGRPEAADEMVEELEAQIADTKNEHPEFAGKTAIVATPYEGIWIYGAEDPRGRFLTSLGYTLPPELLKAADDEFGGNVSEENAKLLDLDTIVWLDEEDAEGPLGGPVYANLDVHEQAREVFLDSFVDPLGAATSFVTVLSYPYLLENLVPRLSLAVDGDPSTKVPNTSGDEG